MKTQFFNQFIHIMCCLLIGSSFGFAKNSNYWQQSVYYRMSVSLDPKEHLLSGESSITYFNNSPDTLDRIYMHLYPNAFQEGSVKHREYQRVHYSGGISKDNPSYIEVKNFKIMGSNGSVSSEFKVDDTILSAFLPTPLVPGDSLKIDMLWDHKVRERAGRAGYFGEQYDFAQWYPKLVVYDEKGWHNVPFHAIGEFYGEFGTYDVTIDVPERHIVGATGIVTEGDPGWESVTVDTSLPFSEWVESLDSVAVDSTARRVVTFHAENVHDFAWVSSPTYVYEHGEWNGIDVHVLYNKNVGEKWTKVVRERGERAVEWLSTKFGPYPYPQVTITHAMRGGGMEYPMLVMNGSESEGLIVHEIGHIWFYGILANNEIDEAWLDEGFTSFQTRWYLENRYPPYGIDFEHSTGYSDFQKKHWSFNSISERDQWSAIRFMTSLHNEPIAAKSYYSLGYFVYRQNAYTKPSLMLQSLQYILGPEVFEKAMQTYYNRWKLKHTNELRFRDVIQEVSGQDLDWFFDQWLHTTYYTDYALKKWSKKPLDDGTYEVVVSIENKAEMLYPLDIDVILANGERFRTRWTNHIYRWEDDFTFVVPDKPQKIILDPDNKTMDVNLLNNVSGFAAYRIRFNWPGMNYNPRDVYVLRWNPVLWYHDLDGFKPGISLRRSYGLWNRLNIFLTAGVESRKVHGEITYSNSLRLLHPSLRFSARGYVLEGVRGGSVNLTYYWRRFYGYPPWHGVNAGVYFSEAYDSLYTDLYEEGRVVVFYGKYGINIDMGKFGGGLNFEISSAPGGVSDWSFARFITQFQARGLVKGTGIATRLIIGFMSSGDEGIPVQEKFTIQAAGSSDWFARPYLRHPSSLYNLKIGSDDFLRNHYHLYGDASLRGYYAHGFEGAENIIAQTLEVTRSLPISKIDVTARTFFDAGWVWSDADELNGKLLMDSGFGIGLKKNIWGANLNIRLDIPIWVSYTIDGIESVDFTRWVFGFDTGL